MGRFGRRLRCLLCASTDPFANLALEHRLVEQDAFREHILLLWRDGPCVVIGRNQIPWHECNPSAVSLVRRHSGGGAVYHDLGNSNYSLFMPRANFSRSWASKLVCDAMRGALGLSALHVNGRNDIFLGDAKVSGSAYKLSRHLAYHHGTLLRSTNSDALCAALAPLIQAEGPNAAVQSVRSKVGNLPHNLSHDDFCAILVDHVKSSAFDDVVVERVDAEDVCTQTLRSWDWLFGKSPRFMYRGVSVDGGRIRLTDGTTVPFDDFLARQQGHA